MIINSEQEMLTFGESFTSQLLDNRNDAFRDHTRLTRSGTSEAPPVTTGGRERVEKSTFRLSHPIELGKKGGRTAAGPVEAATVIELIGDVGTGKTTFVRGLAKGLGIKEPITSPSFTISKSYALPQGGNLIHYDFYRLSNPGLMADDLAENLTNPANIVVIEWGESISNLLPPNHIKIHIKYTDTGREIIL